MTDKVRVVGIAGSSRSGSSAELALRIVLGEAASLGAATSLVAGDGLRLPLYDPDHGSPDPAARRLLDELAQADGIVLASPAYHGSVSGLLKNALDHVEELRDDPRPYFSGRPVGCLAVGQGWQGAASTLSALRDIAHALRGWPTPLGVLVNTTAAGFRPDGSCTEPRLQQQLRAMAAEVCQFARTWRADRTGARLTALVTAIGTDTA